MGEKNPNFHLEKKGGGCKSLKTGQDMLIAQGDTGPVWGFSPCGAIINLNRIGLGFC